MNISHRWLTAALMTMAAATQAMTPTPAMEVTAFWREAGPAMWFAKDPEFDRRFRERFAPLHEAAAAGRLDDWQRTPEGALALLVLLDQYPRNAFRDTARMYATDGQARRVARAAVEAGHIDNLEAPLRKFFVLPFAHSEELADQDFAVELARRIGAEDLARAEHHRDIVRRFGRFPHRNPILGRPTTAEERHYLDGGGYRG
jgi:uncharacterized protein (DUF924 family)